MRTKQIIPGLANSQRIRWILTAATGETVGMYGSIRQVNDEFATAAARVAVYEALHRLSDLRREAVREGTEQPQGLVQAARGFHQVQIDLI
jgi:hypothetical protein